MTLKLGTADQLGHLHYGDPGCGRLFTFFTATSLDFGGPIRELDRLLVTFPNYTYARRFAGGMTCTQPVLGHVSN